MTVYVPWWVHARITFHQRWVRNGPLWWTCRECRTRRR